jgi:hypothetical protein
VAALTDVAPNAHEWNGSPVVVSFPATDEPGGSGLSSSSADVPVNSEGAGQLIEGGAEDNADNAASARVLEKLGMREEVRFREATQFKGRTWDALHYAILEPE